MAVINANVKYRIEFVLGSMGVASQAFLRSGAGVIMGMVFLGASFTLLFAFGLATAVLGVVLINRPTRTLIAVTAANQYD